MTRLIYYDDFRELLDERSKFDTYDDYSFVLDTVDSMPAVEIVHCKDCAFYLKKADIMPDSFKYIDYGCCTLSRCICESDPDIHNCRECPYYDKDFFKKQDPECR